MSSYRADCLACRANAGEVSPPGGVIYQDAGWRLEHSISPAPLAGWLILKPLRHCEGMEELSADEAAALGPLLRRACQALQAATQAEKIYVISLGEAVAHLHLHLVPRDAHHAPEFRGPRVFELMRRAAESGQGAPDEAAAQIAAQVRASLAASE